MWEYLLGYDTAVPFLVERKFKTMYMHPLKIGNIELDNNILLAPMAGITDKSFRIMCEEKSNPRACLYGDG